MSLYLEAAAILESPQTTSLKAIIYNPSKPFKSPQSKLYALIVETLKFQDILKEVVENAGILKLERKLTPVLSILLTHDLLLTKSGIATSSGPLKDAILRHKARLNAEFTRVRLRRGHGDVKSLVEAVNAEHTRESEDGVTKTATGLTTFNPRWVRVNALKTTLGESLASPTFSAFQEVGGMSDMFFFDVVRKYYYPKAELLPNIFAIHPSHDITSSELYKSGKIILQSASSCLPAIMLDPPKGSTVVDGCAAPGNKTTHLAALVGSSGKVFAVERDKRRADILERMIMKAGAEGIVTTLKATDFTTITEGHPAWQASYLLLDPSCSGSGILQRIDWDISKLNLPSSDVSSGQPSRKKRKRDEASQKGSRSQPEEQVPQHVDDEEVQDSDTSKERLQSLSDFQVAIILHAFSFPNARRITYSTCSIHAEENEHVVARVLNNKIAKERGWGVQSREDNPLSTWHRRGLVGELSDLRVSSKEQQRVADGCIRVNRTDSLGGGFFVVCFIRQVDDEGQLGGDIGNLDVALAQGNESLSQELGASIEAGDQEWNGFSDEETNEAVPAADDPQLGKGKRRKSGKDQKARTEKINKRFQKNRKGWS
ncbi:uncharacterized protein DFL_001783 [Arthrobotrys flagrans]|uniref:SAM-dependent MTase RsmB/NOP-type domain-containing protein n=1 Tax=Arthrobotrys flagrans TaxID=97331 RepID=A0A437A8W0_ARTFL|nr:hypothetical protein DFL_001783 [Arthrobotrys flagrans]